MKLTWATRITLLRILLIFPFVSCMLKINDPELTAVWRYAMRYISVVVFLTMAISDAVDGYLARRRNQVTKLGAFLDPLADKLLMTCACLLLASDRGHVEGFLLPPTVVVLIIGKDLFLLMGFIIVYLITMQIRIRPVFIGKMATTLQLTMVAGILTAASYRAGFGSCGFYGGPRRERQSAQRLFTSATEAGILRSTKTAWRTKLRTEKARSCRQKVTTIVPCYI